MDAFCDRVSRQFGEHARALRPVADLLRECGLIAQAVLVERIIRECYAAALATYEDTSPFGIKTTDR